MRRIVWRGVLILLVAAVGYDLWAMHDISDRLDAVNAELASVTIQLQNSLTAHNFVLKVVEP